MCDSSKSPRASLRGVSTPLSILGFRCHQVAFNITPVLPGGVPPSGVADQGAGIRRSSPHRRGSGPLMALTAGQPLTLRSGMNTPQWHFGKAADRGATPHHTGTPIASANSRISEVRVRRRATTRLKMSCAYRWLGSHPNTLQEVDRLRAVMRACVRLDGGCGCWT